EAIHNSRGVLGDQFGLPGLRAYVRKAYDDAVDVTLAIGEDLTRLGLSVLDQ
uniref:Uncharacterized protein n=1 Tax=Parascaris univalens TaxID=6257 RepID=A0A915A406_PARUN